MASDIQKLSELYAGWARGDFGADRDLFAEDAVMEPWADQRVVYRGRVEIAEWARQFLSGWERLRVGATELLEGERGIVVTERITGRKIGADDDFHMRLYSVWTLKHGRVDNVRWETDRLRAYEAARVHQQSAMWDREYSASAGLPFDDSDLETRIVWIWGSPRSGSTWLLRQICHPASLNRREPLGFTLLPDLPKPLRAVPYDEFLISSHVAPVAGPPGRLGDSYMPTTLPGFAGDNAGYAFAERYVDVWSGELRRLILVRLAAVLDRARATGTDIADSPLLVIKEVNGSHAATSVMRMFPRSKLVFLVRDGRDVVDSLIHAYRPGGWMSNHGPQIDVPEARLAWFREACTRWACNLDIVRSAFTAHPEDLRFELRYENLRAETTPTITRLFEWLGLPSGPEDVAEVVDANAFERLASDQRGVTRVNRAAQPGLWRENLSEEEQGVVSEIMGSRLAALGYEDG